MMVLKHLKSYIPIKMFRRLVNSLNLIWKFYSYLERRLMALGRLIIKSKTWFLSNLTENDGRAKSKILIHFRMSVIFQKKKNLMLF